MGGAAKRPISASYRPIAKREHVYLRLGARSGGAGVPQNPWQTDTCIGDWHYNREATYKSPKYVIDMLVDIVSRNGNLLLNFPLPNSGELDYEELVILDEITKSDGYQQRRDIWNAPLEDLR